MREEGVSSRPAMMFARFLLRVSNVTLTDDPLACNACCVSVRDADGNYVTCALTTKHLVIDTAMQNAI